MRMKQWKSVRKSVFYVVGAMPFTGKRANEQAF
jgi:hypothetical protein